MTTNICALTRSRWRLQYVKVREPGSGCTKPVMGLSTMGWPVEFSHSLPSPRLHQLLGPGHPPAPPDQPGVHPPVAGSPCRLWPVCASPRHRLRRPARL